MLKLVSIVALCFIQATFAKNLPACPCGWNRIASKCYLFKKNGVTYDEALKKCNEQGAILALPTSSQENTAIACIAKTEGLNIPWIGIFRRYDNLFVSQVTGLQPQFTSWIIGQPDDYLGNENCGQMYATSDRLGKWNDNECAKTYDYICEMKFP